MADDSSPRLNACRRLNPFCHAIRISDSLSVDDNVMLLSDPAFRTYLFDDLLLIVVIALRDQNVFRTVADTAPQRDVSSRSPHDFNDTAPFMGSRCIPHFINCLHRRIARRVETDRIFGTGNIKVDRTGNTDRINPIH